jgi:hypothetical protein
MIDPSNLGGIPVKIVQLLYIGKLSHPSKIYHSARKKGITMCETSGNINGD